MRTRTAQRKRQAEHEKLYDAYDWVGLSKERKLEKLRVFELRKYLAHNSICLPGAKKVDMIKYISNHLSGRREDREECSSIVRSSLNESSDDNEESNSEEDFIVAGEWESSADEDD